MWAFINVDFIYNDYLKDATFRNSVMSEFFNLAPPLIKCYNL